MNEYEAHESSYDHQHKKVYFYVRFLSASLFAFGPGSVMLFNWVRITIRMACYSGHNTLLHGLLSWTQLENYAHQ